MQIYTRYKQFLFAVIAGHLQFFTFVFLDFLEEHKQLQGIFIRFLLLIFVWFSFLASLDGLVDGILRNDQHVRPQL